MPELAMIVTAAGLSSRFPPNKLLHTIDGQSCIEKTLKTFENLELDIFVVLGHEHGRIQKLISRQFARKITTVFNPKFASGLSSSVIAGIEAAGNRYDYWGFCPGDKPFIQSETVRELTQTLQQAKPLILAPYFNDQPGHPAFFSTKLESDFRSITGDFGGRQLMEAFRDETLIVNVQDSGVVLDMDRYLGQNHVS